MNKEKLRDKFIDRISQGVIFYKVPFLPSEINAIFRALRIEEDIKKRIEVCKLPDNNEDEEVLQALQELIERKK